MDLNEGQVADLLQRGGCPKGRSVSRARLLLKEIEQSSLPIEFLDLVTIQNGYLPDGSERYFDLAEYKMGDTGFSVHNARDSKIQAVNTGGTGFDRGSLTYLARVLEIGDLFGVLQAKGIQNAIKNPPDHLNALNELWWLRWWKQMSKVKNGTRLNPGSKADVDWSFAIGNESLRVNLEVKRRPSDVKRVDPGSVHIDRSVFEEGLISKAGVLKFAPSENGACNVLAVTVFCPMNRAFQNAANQFAANNSLNVDAVAVWSWSGECTPHFAFHTGEGESDADFVRPYLNDPDEEDMAEIHRIEHPIPFP